MEFKTYIVDNTYSTASGWYAVDKISGNHFQNRGYEIGDIVCIWGDDGMAPVKIDVNGVTVWTEKNRIDFWQRRDPENKDYTNPYRKQISYYESIKT